MHFFIDLINCYTYFKVKVSSLIRNDLKKKTMSTLLQLKQSFYDKKPFLS